MKPVVRKFLTPRECGDLVGLIADLKPVRKAARDYRASRDYELPRRVASDIHSRICEFMLEQNRRHFRFRLDSLETVLIAVMENGSESPWHQDYQFYGNTDTTKLSMSVLLQAPLAGGVLNFMDTNVRSPNVGDATVFPAFLTHCVTPVVDGPRIVLVAFMKGQPFR